LHYFDWRPRTGIPRGQGSRIRLKGILGSPARHLGGLSIAERLFGVSATFCPHSRRVRGQVLLDGDRAVLVWLVARFGMDNGDSPNHLGIDDFTLPQLGRLRASSALNDRLRIPCVFISLWIPLVVAGGQL
jgi:hypothetical protein